MDRGLGPDGQQGQGDSVSHVSIVGLEQQGESGGSPTGSPPTYHMSVGDLGQDGQYGVWGESHR